LAKNFDKDIIRDSNNKNCNEVVFCGDIRDIDYNKAIEKSNNIDLIVGGFPCKDFSTLRGGTREGIKVKRGKLYMEFVRSLVELQPKMFIAENVQGLLSANNGKAYETIMKDFKNLNSQLDSINKQYENEKIEGENIEKYNILFSEVIDLSEIGVPQTRKRLIIIGIRDDLISKNNIEKEEEKLEEKFVSNPILEDIPLSTMEVFENKSLKELEEEYKNIMREYEDYIGKLDCDNAQEYAKNDWKEYDFEIFKDYKMINKNDELKISEIQRKHNNIINELNYNESLQNKQFEDETNQELRETYHVKERMRHIAPGGNHNMVKNSEYHISAMMSNIYQRIHPLKPSPTIIAKGGGGTWGYHYRNKRSKLTNRERARIQTFPDDFEFTGTSTQIREQIGNAVPPLGAKKIGEEVYRILEEYS
jgi:DNA (cytosine-5)-methyltransferase 1